MCRLRSVCARFSAISSLKDWWATLRGPGACLRRAEGLPVFFLPLFPPVVSYRAVALYPVFFFPVGPHFISENGPCHRHRFDLQDLSSRFTAITIPPRYPLLPLGALSGKSLSLKFVLNDLASGICCSCCLLHLS